MGWDEGRRPRIRTIIFSLLHAHNPKKYDIFHAHATAVLVLIIIALLAKLAMCDRIFLALCDWISFRRAAPPLAVYLHVCVLDDIARLRR
jgi:rhamnose utilization protein RhaD (predicted bifunctional aldolase and dehydrogenase)